MVSAVASRQEGCSFVIISNGFASGSAKANWELCIFCVNALIAAVSCELIIELLKVQVLVPTVHTLQQDTDTDAKRLQRGWEVSLAQSPVELEAFGVRRCRKAGRETICLVYLESERRKKKLK